MLSEDCTCEHQRPSQLGPVVPIYYGQLHPAICHHLAREALLRGTAESERQLRHYVQRKPAAANHEGSAARLGRYSYQVFIKSDTHGSDSYDDSYTVRWQLQQ